MEEVAQRWQRWAAAALGACVVVAVTLAFGFGLAAHYTLDEAISSFLATNGLIGLTFGLCGALLAWHRPRNAVGWVTLGVGVFYAVSAVASTAAALAHQEGGPVWLVRVCITVFMYSWPVAVGLFLPLVLLLFPDGSPLSPMWRGVVVLVVVNASLFVLMVGAGPGSPGPHLPAGFLVLPFYDRLSWLWTGTLVTNALIQVLALVGLGLRYRGGDERLRRQLLWLLLAALMVVVGSSLWAFLDGAPVLLLLVIPLIPVAIVVAILKDNLLDIRLLLSRALVYSILSGAVFGMYALLVSLFQQMFAARYGSGLLAALMVALAFGPARSRLQRLVDRALYGSRHDPAQTMTHLSSHLTTAALGGLDGVVSSLRESLRLPFVALESNKKVLASSGSNGADTATVDLVYAERSVGALVVGLRRGEARLDAADEAVLQLVAAPFALAVHAHGLAGELQESRQRAVSAREEERRRLRRDLHDGLGPQLTGIAFHADAGANLVFRDAEEAQRLLELVAGDTREAIADVRRLVYGLRPPVLDDLGLVAALEQHLESLPHPDGFPVNTMLQASPLPPLPTAVEVAAYRIVTEAVTNTTRHSDATQLTVRLCHRTTPIGGELVIDVTDDGRGPKSAWHSGVGLTAMHERADELGGSCEAGPTPDGGRVLAHLPVDA